MNLHLYQILLFVLKRPGWSPKPCRSAARDPARLSSWKHLPHVVSHCLLFLVTEKKWRMREIRCVVFISM